MQRFFVLLEQNRLRCEVNASNPALNHSHVIIEQFIVSRGDMPCFDFPTQVLVKHGRKKKMIFVADEYHLSGAGQIEGRKQPCKPAAENHYSGLSHEPRYYTNLTADNMDVNSIFIVLSVAVFRGFVLFGGAC